MKKILFISFPVSGHVNPQLKFCKEMAEKDVKLVYYTFDKYFPKFKGVENIELRKYPDSFFKYYTALESDTSLHTKLLALMYVFYALAEQVLPFIMEEVKKEKPDMIICDSLAIWGKIAARFYNIRYAFFFSSLMGDSLVIKKSPSFRLSIIKSIVFDFPYMLKILAILKKIERQYGKTSDQPMEVMSHQGNFTMVMTSREFHPGGSEYPDNVKFIGPAHVEDSAIPDNKDTIFISLGTIACSDTFWDTAIEASKDLGYNVVVSFGGNANNKVNTKSLPANVKIYNNLTLDEYKDVLRQSILFISHGGFNSISDSILYKTPLLICPGQAEQISNGKLIEEYGCGILHMPNKLNVDDLRKKIMEVINNGSIIINLEKYRQSFLNSMGYKKVIEELNKEFNLF